MARLHTLPSLPSPPPQTYRRGVIAASFRFGILERAAFASHGLTAAGERRRRAAGGEFGGGRGALAAVAGHGGGSGSDSPLPAVHVYHLLTLAAGALWVVASAPAAGVIQAALSPELPHASSFIAGGGGVNPPLPSSLAHASSFIAGGWGVYPSPPSSISSPPSALRRVLGLIADGVACALAGGSAAADGSASILSCPLPITTDSQCSACALAGPALLAFAALAAVSHAARARAASRSVSLVYPAYSVRGYVTGAEARRLELQPPPPPSMAAAAAAEAAKAAPAAGSGGGSSRLSRLVSPTVDAVGGRAPEPRFEGGPGANGAAAATAAAAAAGSGSAAPAPQERAVDFWPPFHVLPLQGGPLAAAMAAAAAASSAEELASAGRDPLAAALSLDPLATPRELHGGYEPPSPRGSPLLPPPLQHGGAGGSSRGPPKPPPVRGGRGLAGSAIITPVLTAAATPAGVFGAASSSSSTTARQSPGDAAVPPVKPVSRGGRFSLLSSLGSSVRGSPTASPRRRPLPAASAPHWPPVSPLMRRGAHATPTFGGAKATLLLDAFSLADPLLPPPLALGGALAAPLLGGGGGASKEGGSEGHARGPRSQCASVSLPLLAAVCCAPVSLALVASLHAWALLLAFPALAAYAVLSPTALLASPLRMPPGEGVSAWDVVAWGLLLLAQLLRPLLRRVAIGGARPGRAVDAVGGEGYSSLAVGGASTGREYHTLAAADAAAAAEAAALDAVLAVLEGGMVEVISDVGDAAAATAATSAAAAVLASDAGAVQAAEGGSAPGSKASVSAEVAALNARAARVAKEVKAAAEKLALQRRTAPRTSRGTVTSAATGGDGSHGGPTSSLVDSDSD